MHYILFYQTVDGYVEKRQPYREKHLQLAQQAYKDGILILAGALDEPADSAVLIFQCKNKSTVEHFAESDPYVQNGLIKKWEVRPWTVVIGNN